MRTFYAVFDTNVLVSALMSKPQIGRQREACGWQQSVLRLLGAPRSRREIKPQPTHIRLAAGGRPCTGGSSDRSTNSAG